jgi:predicted ArsR family transcriptional regulator
LPIIKEMTGMTMQEIADELGITRYAVKQRILRAGIKPITKEAIYDTSVVETIRNVPPKGRPKKPKPE